jgi:transcriptional regulator with XRE-family HTH domain
VGVDDQLRQLRKAAGITGRRLAELAAWQPSKLSRLESGLRLISEIDLAVWASARRARTDPGGFPGVVDTGGSAVGLGGLVGSVGTFADAASSSALRGTTT